MFSISQRTTHLLCLIYSDLKSQFHLLVSLAVSVKRIKPSTCYFILVGNRHPPTLFLYDSYLLFCHFVGLIEFLIPFSPLYPYGSTRLISNFLVSTFKLLTHMHELSSSKTYQYLYLHLRQRFNKTLIVPILLVVIG